MNKTDIRKLYDPTTFESAGHALVALLTRYLADNLQGHSRVLDWQPPAEAQLAWQEALPQIGTLTPAQLLQTIEQQILTASLHIHHPRNLGHQVAPPLPLAALCDLVAALINQAMAVYETGPSATLLERQVLLWLNGMIGWDGAEGVLTSGGAQANLTALLAARQVQAGWDVWQQGISAGPPLRLLASEHAHYSVSRAAGIMGMGTDAVIKIAADAAGRMRPDALANAVRECRARSEQPFAVVATAGCTPTGSMDPLRKIGEFCRENELWLHVDGAHGASALMSERYQALLDGIELANSVVWDGHKLSYMPATVSAVLFRDGRHSYAAFAQEASYLFQGDSAAEESFNTSYRTLECTKRMMALKWWAGLSLYGKKGLGRLVEEVFATARALADQLAASPDFELLMPPQTNIVCFRHRPPQLESDALSAHQARLRQTVVQSGAFHLTQVKLNGELWLRTTIMNPLTDDIDLTALLSTLRSAA